MDTDAKVPVALRLTGELTIRTAAKTHHKLVAALAKGELLVIDTSKVTDADLTFVQLIEAARRSAATEKKSITIASPIAKPLRDVLERGGFLDASDSATFWRQ